MRILFALLLVSGVAFGQVNTTKKIAFKEGETLKTGIVISGLTNISRMEITFRPSVNANTILRKFSTVDGTITLSDTTYTFSFTDLQTIGKAGRGTWQVEIRSEAGVKKTDVYTYEIYKATTLTGSTTPATAGGYNYLFEWDFTPTTPTFDVIASGIIVVDDVSISSALNGKVDKVTGKQLSTEDYTTVEKNKLSGIATGATANSTDSQLRDRTTHTGAQAISTVTGLQTALNGKGGFIEVDEVADIIPYLPVTSMTVFLVDSDTVRLGGDPALYFIWPSGKFAWAAMVIVPNLLTP